MSSQDKAKAGRRDIITVEVGKHSAQGYLVSENGDYATIDAGGSRVTGLRVDQRAVGAA